MVPVSCAPLRLSSSLVEPSQMWPLSLKLSSIFSPRQEDVSLERGSPFSRCFRQTRIMRYASSSSAPSRVPQAVFGKGTLSVWIRLCRESCWNARKVGNQEFFTYHIEGYHCSSFDQTMEIAEKYRNGQEEKVDGIPYVMAQQLQKLAHQHPE